MLDFLKAVEHGSTLQRPERADQGRHLPEPEPSSVPTQEQDMRRTVPWRAEQGSAPTKNAACKGGIFVPALPEQQ
ncbi:hypothetical protein ACI703_12240 [Isoptericola jiangsuensis]|uniref:hypothetical protein n=1 Tax=Isoptericola jiangsuensis TaxID=548579 RepID=UPI003865E03D